MAINWYKYPSLKHLHFSTYHTAPKRIATTEQAAEFRRHLAPNGYPVQESDMNGQRRSDDGSSPQDASIVVQAGERPRRAVQRMERTGFPPSDPLYQSARRAYQKVCSLRVDLHYRGCESGVGRKPGGVKRHRILATCRHQSELLIERLRLRLGLMLLGRHSDELAAPHLADDPRTVNRVEASGMQS